jgi:hypothetical protein
LLVDEASKIVETLRDRDRCAAVLVGLPERWPLTELGELSVALREELGVEMGGMVVNKRWPAAEALGPRPPGLDGASGRAWDQLAEVARRGARQDSEVQAWLGSSAPGVELLAKTGPMISLPFLAGGFDGPDDFDTLRAGFASQGEA